MGDMGYSLLSRFRGVMVGAGLGSLARARQFSDMGPGLTMARGNLLGDPAPDWVALATDLAQQYLRNPGQPQIVSAPLLQLEETALAAEALAGVGVATLPMALLFYDDWSALQHHLQGAIAPWPDAQYLVWGGMITGYALSLALTGQLQPLTLVEQILTYLDLPSSHGLLTAALQAVQDCLIQGVGADALCTRLGLSTAAAGAVSRRAQALPLALYCFLSTPDDAYLTLQQAVRLERQHGLTACANLAGALSGAYNSWGGLPPAWRVYLAGGTAALPAGWQPWVADSAMGWQNLGDRLLALWAGAYSLDTFLTAPRSEWAVADPVRGWRQP